MIQVWTDLLDLVIKATIAQRVSKWLHHQPMNAHLVIIVCREVQINLHVVLEHTKMTILNTCVKNAHLASTVMPRYKVMHNVLMEYKTLYRVQSATIVSTVPNLKTSTLVPLVLLMVSHSLKTKVNVHAAYLVS